MSNYLNHVAPDKAAIEQNKQREPLGEQIRAELIALLDKYRIVGINLDTEQYQVSIDIVRLPPDIKSVLTLWGSIYVLDEPAPARKEESAE